LVLVAGTVPYPSPEIRYREFRPLPAEERGEVKRDRKRGEVTTTQVAA